MNAIVEHNAMLLRQCPAPPARPSAEEIKNLPIHVTEWGTSGPEVLIVHGGVQGGLGGGPRTFGEQKVLSQRGWRLRVVDRPGFGKSASRGVDDQEADAVWIADMLGGGAHLMGHSWGGALALLAAAHRPEAVRSLVLVEPAFQRLLASDPIMERDPAVKADMEHTMAALLAAPTPAEYGLAAVRVLGVDASDNAAANTGIAALKDNPSQAAAFGCALLQARPAPPDTLRRAAASLEQAKIPVLIISGGWSPSIDAAGAIAAELTGGRFVIVRSPNHFPQISNVVEFNNVVDAFMREAETCRPLKRP